MKMERRGQVLVTVGRKSQQGLVHGVDAGERREVEDGPRLPPCISDDGW